MKRYIFIPLVLLYFWNTSYADWKDCVEATCRVTNQVSRKSAAIGTGCCYKVDDQYAYVVTNKHVVGTKQKSVDCDFWLDGYEHHVKGTVVPNSSSFDVITIKVSLKRLGYIPPAIPLGSVDYVPSAGDPFVTVGCAKGAWASLVVGHVVSYSQSPSNQGLRFIPNPAHGRSGSTIVDSKGQYIIGLVRATDGDYGYAVNLGAMYDALVYDPGASENSKLQVYCVTTKWCIACREQEKIIEQLQEEGFFEKNGIEFKYLTLDDSVVEKYGIKAVPTTLVIKDGEVISKVVGLVSYKEFTELPYMQLDTCEYAPTEFDWYDFSCCTCSIILCSGFVVYLLWGRRD